MPSFSKEDEDTVYEKAIHLAQNSGVSDISSLCEIHLKSNQKAVGYPNSRLDTVNRYTAPVNDLHKSYTRSHDGGRGATLTTVENTDLDPWSAARA
ncbi:hypothetical protein STEG23_029436 [Scotinomys teguina]